MSRLHRAAAAAGLQRDWEDADSRPQRVDDAVLDTVLARLDPSPAAERFVSAEIDRPFTVPGLTGPAEITLEDGSRRSLVVGENGQVPGIDRVGYHRVEAKSGSARLAIAPATCPAVRARSWGAAVQIPALRGTAAGAFGDLGTLAEAAAALGAARAQAVAISPTHALFPNDPSRFSPYAPSTRLFGNVWLADAGLIGQPPPPAPSGDLIDWQAAVPARMRHLRHSFAAAGPGVHDAVAAYRRERGEALEAHARFDALHEVLGGAGWQDWPAEFHDPDSEAVARFAADRAEAVTFYAFLQWLTEQSLIAAQARARETMAIGLIADLAVGMAAGGQPWLEPARRPPVRPHHRRAARPARPRWAELGHYRARPVRARPNGLRALHRDDQGCAGACRRHPDRPCAGARPAMGRAGGRVGEPGRLSHHAGRAPEADRRDRGASRRRDRDCGGSRHRAPRVSR